MEVAAVAVDSTSTPVALEVSIAAPDADAARRICDRLRALSLADATAAFRLHIASAETPLEWGGPVEDESPMAGRVPALSVLIGVSGWLEPNAALPTSDWWDAGGKPRSKNGKAWRAPVGTLAGVVVGGTRGSQSEFTPCGGKPGTGLAGSGKGAARAADASAVGPPALGWEKAVAHAAEAGEPIRRDARPPVAAGSCSVMAALTGRDSSPDAGAPPAAPLPPKSDEVEWLAAMGA
jgi:hypothetical protein